MTKTAIERYVSSAVDHGRATRIGDSRACNVAYGFIAEALKALRGTPDRGEAALTQLLSHPDESVRTWASTHLLPLNETLACRVLEGVAANSGPVAFSAAMVLKGWRAGRLKVP